MRSLTGLTLCLNIEIFWRFLAFMFFDIDIMIISQSLFWSAVNLRGYHEGRTRFLHCGFACDIFHGIKCLSYPSFQHTDFKTKKINPYSWKNPHHLCFVCPTCNTRIIAHDYGYLRNVYWNREHISRRYND